MHECNVHKTNHIFQMFRFDLCRLIQWTRDAGELRASLMSLE